MSIFVTRSSMPPFEEYCSEIKELWDTHWLTNNGCKHIALEKALCGKLGCKHTLLFSNGHLALEAVLRAMGLKGEVITTPFTFASTTHALVRCGLTPVFCDVRRSDYTIDPDKIEALITDKTCAILPVHVYGNLCDVDAIAAIAKRHHLKVIYDAAHAFAVEKDGVGVSLFGDASMFSFHATKVFNTIEGGAVVCESDELAKKLQLERNFGIEGPEDVPAIGGNAKMNEFQAAMGLCNLRHLDEEIAKRRLVCEKYHQLLDGHKGIRLCQPEKGIEQNYSYMPVVFEGFKKTRDEAFDQLAKAGYHARKYFYPITNAYECYKGRAGFDPSLTPVALEVAGQVLTLPVYADLSLEDVERIASIVLE